MVNNAFGANRRFSLMFKDQWPLFIFALSIVSFVAFRSTQAVFLNYDGMALAEAAWRYSQGLGLTSSLFVEHSLDISEPAVRKVLTWWAPMAPITVGTLVKWGMSLSEAHTAYYTFWLFVLWSGWFFITARYLAGWLRLHPFVALLIAFSPWYFSPQRDIDEIVMNALIPWATVSVVLLHRDKVFYGSALAASVCFVTAIYCNQAVGLIFITLLAILAVANKPSAKLFGAATLVIAFVASWIMKKSLSAASPEYLRPTFESFTDLLSLAFKYANIIGIAPLLCITDFVLPISVTHFLTGLHEKERIPGLITIIVLLFVLCYLVFKIKKNLASGDSLSAWVFYLATILCVWPLFIITCDLFLPGEQRLGKEKPYYLTSVPAVLFLTAGVLAVLFKNSRLKTCNKLAGVFFVYMTVFTLTGLCAPVSRAGENINGYKFKKNQWMKNDDCLIQLEQHDYDLGALEEQPQGVVFSSGTAKMALANKNSKHEIRPVPLRSYWRKAYSSRPVTLYFILEEGRPPKPLGILKATTKDRSEYSPPLKELFGLPGWRMIEGEVKFCRTYSTKGIVCRKMRIYRADIPAGWRGETLFAD